MLRQGLVDRTPTDPSEDDRRLCIACGAATESTRCEGCGVALAPGGFVVERVLAQTAHSRVYLARTAQGERVALKELLFALVPSVSQLEAFERESTLLRRLEHPGVPRFVASFSEGTGPRTRLYLAQEYVSGRNLEEVVKREGPLPQQRAVEICVSVLRILGELQRHSPPVFHRDVKPQNIIERPDGSIALVDYGAAREFLRGETHGATLVGTFGYVPPEQLGGSVDRTSDVYALAASLMFMLSGREPVELLTDELNVRAPSQLTLGEGLRSWLNRATARRPVDRYPDASTALVYLYASTGDDGHPSGAGVLTARGRLLAERAWGVYGIGSALAVPLMALGTLELRSVTRHSPPARLPTLPAVDTPVRAPRLRPLDLVRDALPPRLISADRPSFPAVPPNIAINTSVTVVCQLTAHGVVDQCSQTSGDALFRPEALRVLSTHRYKPAMRDGRAVPVWMQYDFDFTAVD